MLVIYYNNQNIMYKDTIIWKSHLFKTNFTLFVKSCVFMIDFLDPHHS